MKLYRFGVALAFALLLIVPSSRAAESAGKTVELFDGTSTNGWHQAGPGSFEFKDGILTSKGGMGLFWYDQEFGNFILQLDWKVENKNANSGVFVRFPNPGNDPGVAIEHGHEIQICDTESRFQTGAIYNFKNPTEIASRPPGEWNHYIIKVVGQHYTVTLNGKVVNEFDSPDRPLHGYIGIQNHPPDSVSFRNIKVTELPAESATKPAFTPIDVKGTQLEPGVVAEYYKDVASFDALPGVDATPFLVRVENNIDYKYVNEQFENTKLANDFGARWTGYLKIDKPVAGGFMLRSDGGARLYLNGQLVIDNSNWKPMKEHELKLNLEPGVYKVRVDFQHGPGREATCQLQWRETPEGSYQPVPASALFHAQGADTAINWDKAGWENTLWSHRKWAEKYGQIYDKMDYGPFFSATVKISDKNYADKGLAILVNKEPDATMLFDTELLRYAGGWFGGFLNNHGVVFDGHHGVDPGPDGKMIFESPAVPGCAVGEQPVSDPRPRPYGPLPRKMGHYRGRYLHGDQVILSYTVGDRAFLETPSMQMADHEPVFIRTLRATASDQPTLLLIARNDPKIAVALSPNLTQKTVNGDLWAVIPPSANATDCRIAISQKAQEPAAVAIASQKLPDLTKLTDGGPAHWGAPIETKGVVAKSDAPYVVDTLTAPEENPYHSWLRFGGMGFFSDGRVAITTWSGDVWIVSGIDKNLEHLKWKRFATGLFQPLGLKIVNDQIYVLGRDQITRLHDLNHDGEADFYENFNNDCEVTESFHEFSFDLQTDSQGNFYYSKAGPVAPGGSGWQVISDDNGAILQVSKDGKHFERYASGLRAPNGMSVGPNDVMTVADNEGTWTPACRLSIVHKGSFLGVPDLAHTTPKPTTFDPPICWIPHSVDNSSGGQVWVTSDKWGPFKDRLLHMSYGTCSLFLVSYEYADGVPEGGVIRFPLEFATGIMRARFSPIDHQLYVTGLRGWQTTAAKDGALQRVRYTGMPVHMPSKLHVKPDGIQITFTTPLDSASATDLDNYAIEQWMYQWTSGYGSAEWSLADPKTQGHDPVDITKVSLSPDHKTIFLALDGGVQPVMQMKIQMKIKAADGSPIDYTLYNTINKVPGKPGMVPNERAPSTQPSARK